MRMSGSVPGPQRDEARARGSLKLLVELWQFVRPYSLQLAGAMTALVLSSGTVLALGMGLRRLVDEGFSTGNAALLNQAVLVLFGVVFLLALAIYARFYLVSWIGERVVADIRRKVFDHILKLSPAYYELTRTGEVLSRLTTDTTLLQTVVGSSVSIAIRNFLLLIGGTVLLIVTSPKLTALVFLVVPLVLLPVRVETKLAADGTTLRVRVTPDGTAESTLEVAGYSILEAGSKEEALELARIHPHLQMPGGCTIEVHESQALPGT